MTVLLSFIVIAVSGCAGGSPFQGVPQEQVSLPAGSLEDISNYDLPQSTQAEDPEATAVVITEGSRANVRSGPGLGFPIVAKALPGDTFEVLGKSDDGEWWQICCVENPDSDAAEATESAWLATSVVQIEGEGGSIDAVAPVFDETLAADWDVDWQCGSERCERKQCTATVTSKVDDGSEDWLQMQQEATWDDSCFPTDTWTFEVDRFTGQERTGVYADNFLFNYWLGRQPGEATNVYTLADGRKVAVWCSGPHEVEIEEEDGWVTAYEGKTCHDVNTGMLVLLSYTKRWLFTGEHNGEQYERAYFGDYESLEQRLDSTTAGLMLVE